MKVSCYLEEYADDKPTFADNLKRNAPALAEYLAEHPQIRSHAHEANYGKLLDGRTLSKDDMTKLAERLASVKSQHANFATRFPKSDPVVRSAEFVERALDVIEQLLPLYMLRAEAGYRLSR